MSYSVYSLQDERFRRYGQVLDEKAADIIEEARKIELPRDKTVYLPDAEEFEAFKPRYAELLGCLPLQIGYCYGQNRVLGALEWHESNEINIAVTDFILFLGKLQEMENGRYSSEKLCAFRVKRGDVIRIYSDTLHFCPCQTEQDGFGCIVILHKGTNTPLDAPAADPLLFRKNKRIIAHEENTALIEKGVFPGLTGENYTV